MASAARAECSRADRTMVCMRTTPTPTDDRLRRMPTLSEILLVPGNRPKVIADCGQLITEEVDSKGGLTGLAVKGAFAIVKAVKPGFVAEAVDHMLDDFVRRLEPF